MWFFRAFRGGGCAPRARLEGVVRRRRVAHVGRGCRTRVARRTIRRREPRKLVPRHGEPISFTITHVEPDVGFTDETEVPGSTMRFRHHVERLEPERVRITHRVEFDGPAAWEIGPVIGPKLAAGIPSAVRALAEAAESASLRG